MVYAIESSTTRDHTLRIRFSEQERDCIDRAARVLGKTRSEFMRETICREAENVLRDRAFLQLDDEAFSRFDAMLDAPPAPSAELRRLLRTRAPWE